MGQCHYSVGNTVLQDSRSVIG